MNYCEIDKAKRK